MTTQELINEYQIVFENKQIQLDPDPNYSIYKTPSTNRDLLTQFLIDWNDPDEIEETMVTKLENVLSNEVEMDESDAHNVYVNIFPNESQFYSITSQTPVFSIPTQDFYDILILWRDFLREAPNGSTTFV
jgi:hypothetical protein